MILTLYRDSKGPDSTIGRLCIGEGLTEYLFCYTIEDESRAKKVAGKTRMPAGTYEVGIRKGSPMANRYDSNYHDIAHDGMLWLKDVPDFEYVYIHVGNDHEDTKGCILVNLTAYLDANSGGGSGGRSTQAYKKLYPIIRKAISLGEKVLITIKDEGVK